MKSTKVKKWILVVLGAAAALSLAAIWVVIDGLPGEPAIPAAPKASHITEACEGADGEQASCEPRDVSGIDLFSKAGGAPALKS